MKYALKRDVVWLKCLPIADNVATILLLGGGGHVVPVPASLLLAVSPLVRNILDEHLPPAFSQSCICLPSATEDVLKVFKNILSTGEASDGHEDRMKEVRQIFEMLGIDALLVSCQSESISVGQVFDGKVEYVEEETVKVETMSTETEYPENVPPISQKSEMVFSKVVNSSVFKESDNVIGTSAFEIKVEPDVAHLVNDSVQIIKEVPHKCVECKYACYDKAELKTHYQTSHKRRSRFCCQDCVYTCSNMGGLEYHCATTGHKAIKAAAACKACDYIAPSKEELFKHKKKVHIPAGKLFECGECSWLGKELSGIRHHAFTTGHRSKHDYEAVALTKAEAMGSTAVSQYHKLLVKAIKRARKNH